MLFIECLLDTIHWLALYLQELICALQTIL